MVRSKAVFGSKTSRLSVLLMALLTHWYFLGAATAATYVVNIAGDASSSASGTGSGLSGDLRYCLSNAIADAQADTIVFDASVAGSQIALDPTLVTALGGTTSYGATAFILRAGNNITVVGSGASISGQSLTRLFFVPNGASLTLQDLTLTGGLAKGGNGGVGAYGGGGGAAGLGGAIWNQGSVTVNNSTLTANTATGGNGGAGLGGAGQGVSGGGGGLGGDGGASSGFAGGAGGPPNAGTGATSAGNIGGAGGFGGGGGGGAADIDEVGHTDGGAGGFGGGGGGGYDNGGQGGFGGGGGAGGIYSNVPAVSVFGGGSGGATFNTFGNGGGGGAGLGGAIFNDGGQLSLTNSTVSGNTVNGGAGGAATAGSKVGTAGSALGSAIFNRDGTVNLNSCTIAANTGGAVYNLADTDGLNATLNLFNSILANSTGDVDLTNNQLAGTATVNASAPHSNLVKTSNVLSGTFNNSGVIPGDPHLGPLGNNGGPTATLLPGAGSPAIDTGNNADASGLTTDQRHFSPRISGLAIDLGAVESIPIVQFAVTSETVDQSAGTFSVTITQPAASSADTVIPLTLGGTAVSGTDYSGVPSSITLPAGQTSVTITGTLVNDPGVDRTLTFTLGTPNNADLGANTVNTLTITEPLRAEFTVASESVDVSAGTFSIPITISGGPKTIPLAKATTISSSTFASAGINYPFGIKTDASGNVYVVNLSGETVSKYGPDGTLINAAFIGGLNSPNGIAIDAAGNFYVSTASGGNKISKYDPNGTLINASYITGLSGPQDIAFDSAGNLYVANIVANTVAQYDPNGRLINASFITGLDSPAGLAFDASGNLYVTNYVPGGAVGKYSPTGAAINTAFLTGLNGPVSVAIDAAGNFYVASLGANQVVQYDSTGALLSSGLAPGLQFPIGVAVDRSGSLFVVNNTSNTVIKIFGAAPLSFTLGGTAVDGTDYSGLSANPLLIAPGQTSATITGTILAGANKTVVFTLGSGQGISPGPNSVNTLTLVSAPAITSSSTVNFTAGDANTFTVTTTGGPAPRLTETGTLPTGVVFVDNGNGTATFAGTPTAGISGSFHVVITASNGIAPDATQSLTLNVGVSGLSSLTLSAGTLSPVFKSTTTSYTAAVSGGTFTLTVTPTALADSVTVNGTPVASGTASGSINLAVGSNPITIIVTTSDGLMSKTYTVNVTRAVPSTVATLSAIKLSSGTLSPGFSSATTSYNAPVSYATSSITVTPTATAGGIATVTVNGSTVASGAASTPITLNVGSNSIPIVVTAQDGMATKSYTLNVTRLTLPDVATTTPTLVTATTATVNGTINAEGTPTAASLSYGLMPSYGTAAAVTPASVTGSTVTPVSAKLTGLKPLTMYHYQFKGVSAAGTVTSTPDATFTTLNNVATLSSLVAGGVTLSPAFSSATLSYTGTVSNTTPSITLTPTLTDTNASMTINGTMATSGNAATINLNAGSNPIRVVVTSQDGSVIKTYTVTVTRTALLPVVNTGATPTFVGTTTATLTGDAIANNAATTLSFDYGTSTSYGSNAAATPATISDTTDTPMTVNLTGLKPGTLYHYRAKAVNVAGTKPGNDFTFTTTNTLATLSALKTSAGTLSPAFASGALSYTVTVLSTTTSITVTPTVTLNSHATVTVNSATVTSGMASLPVPLSVGANPIPIVVTAQDGTTVQTYTINVIVPAAPAASTLAATAVTATTATLNGTVDADGASTTASFNYGTTAAYGKTAAATPAMVTGLTAANVSAKLTGLTPKTTYYFQTKSVNSLGTNLGGGLTFYTPNNVATLSGLALDSATLSPAFSSAGITYTAKVSNTVASVNVTPTVTDTNATATINGAAAVSGSLSTVNLNVGSNVIHVVVTAEDHTTTKTYTVTVTRTAVAPNMTTVAATSVGTTSATLNGTAMANFANSTLSFDYGVGTALSTNVAANPSTATGNASTPMSVTLTGLKPGTSYSFRAKGVNLGGTGTGTPMTFTTINTLATLSALKVGTGTLTPAFAAATTTYNVTVPDAVTSITVSPTVTANSNATVTVGGSSVASGGSSTVNLNSGPNTISVAVTAQDMVTTKTYTITVNRLILPDVTTTAPTLITATSATLNGTVNAHGTTTTATLSYGLTPSFGTPATLTPSSITGSTVTSVSAKLTGLKPLTMYYYQIKGVSAAGTVTSAPGATFTTLNNVATLSGLTAAGVTLSPVFSPTTVSYTGTVGNSTPSIILLPTSTDSNASVTINGSPARSGIGASIALNTGSNVIHVVVTSQDHSATKTYTVTVTRTATGQSPAKKSDAPAQTTPATVAAATTTAAAADASSTSSKDPADTSASTPIKAQLTGPVANGGVLTGATAAFTWNAGRGVGAYWLSVGSTVGGTDLYDSNQGLALSRSVTVPTDGSDLYVTLRSLINGTWKTNNYVFTTTDTTKAVITAPADQSVLAGASTVFTWKAIPGATSYWLSVGSTATGIDLYDATAGTALTQTVTLPTDGRDLFVTLQTNINGQWLASNSTFTAASNPVTPATPATAPASPDNASAPAAGGDAPPASSPTPSPDAGSTAPADASSSPTGATTVPPSASAAATTPAPIIPARMTAPSDNAVLPGSSATFTWTAGTGVSEYRLIVGTTTIATDLYDAGLGTRQTVTIPVPVDGGPIYVTLRSLINGQWQSNQYIYQATLPK